MTDQMRTGPTTQRGRRVVVPLALVAATVALATVLGGLWWLDARGDGLTQHRADVAKKGSTVMPFDLDKTTHVFTKKPTGGVQTVTADNPADTTQIRLIREHLQEEATSFSRGDFTDPAAVHGHDMPGLAELRAGAGRVRVQYQALSNGARLSYATSEATLIEGIHSWFDAQSKDHG